MVRFVRREVCVLVAIAAFVGLTSADEPKVPVATPAATSAEAVEAVVSALQRPDRKPFQTEDFNVVLDDLTASFKALRPHVSGSSQEVMDAFGVLVAEAKAHDIVARKQFGKKKLNEVSEYMPAGSVAWRLTTTSMLLSQQPGAKTEVVRKTEKSATEVVVELRWRVGEGDASTTMDETLVVVKEKDGWKVLLPTRRVPFGIDLLNDTPRPVVVEVWDAEKVRKSNKEIIRTLQATSARIKKLTAKVEAGKYPNAEAYVPAVYAVGDEGK